MSTVQIKKLRLRVVMSTLLARATLGLRRRSVQPLAPDPSTIVEVSSVLHKALEAGKPGPLLSTHTLVVLKKQWLLL